MNALEEGVEHHKRLEVIFAGPEQVKTPTPIDWNAELQKVLSKPRPSTAKIADENVLNFIIGELDHILDGGDSKLRAVFEETLRNDGVYEYTSTGSCDGAETFEFRRSPAFAAIPSRWDQINGIPKEAKYNND